MAMESHQVPSQGLSALPSEILLYIVTEIPFTGFKTLRLINHQFDTLITVHKDHLCQQIVHVQHPLVHAFKIDEELTPMARLQKAAILSQTIDGLLVVCSAQKDDNTESVEAVTNDVRDDELLTMALHLSKKIANDFSTTRNVAALRNLPGVGILLTLWAASLTSKALLADKLNRLVDNPESGKLTNGEQEAFCRAWFIFLIYGGAKLAECVLLLHDNFIDVHWATKHQLRGVLWSVVDMLKPATVPNKSPLVQVNAIVSDMNYRFLQKHVGVTKLHNAFAKKLRRRLEGKGMTELLEELAGSF